MDSKEIKLQLKMDYCELCNYLLKKYGPVPYDYFNIYGNDITTVNSKNARAKTDGLFIHHMDEDKSIMLSSAEHARKNPLEYQKAERLVYCNILEHLILHFKIDLENTTTSSVGVGGALNFIVIQINDYFLGYEFKAKYWAKVFSLIESNFNDYVKVLEYYLKENIKKKFSKIYLLYLIDRMTNASKQKKLSDVKAHLNDIIDAHKISDKELETIFEKALKGSSKDKFDIVEMYLIGLKVDYNNKEIKKWCKLAMEDKNPEIMYKVSLIFRNIRELKENYLDILIESATMGHTEAMASLGEYYSKFRFNNETALEDKEQCIKWLKLAIEKDSINAKKTFADTFLYDETDRNLIKAALIYATELADNGDVEYMVNLGRVYIEGEIIEKDYRKSLKYFLMAYEKYDKSAKEGLRINYLEFLKYFNSIS